MINWDEFEHIHVIKKLKQILNSWWNIDVVFTDERGQLKAAFQKNGNSNLCNPAVSAFMSKENALDSLSESVKKSIEDLRLSENRYSIRKWETAGFDIAVVPIVIDGDFMGTVVALGFLK